MVTNQKLNYLIIFVISVIIFHFSYGLSKLDPTNINWLMSAYHDWGTHYLGWAFYRNDSWTFPLGEIQSYNYPVATNIGLTDSIPLMALILKPFSFLLPTDFQYFGFWLFLCIFFCGYYTFKIFEIYKTNRIISFLVVAVVMINPVLHFRSIHPALCAQWLILGSFYYNLKLTNNQNVDQINRKQMLLLFLSATITPYLTAMIIAFNIVLPLKQYLLKLISLKKAVLYPLASFTVVFIFWSILGIIEFHSGTNLASFDDYKNYSFNLNGFFDSYGYYSKFIPDLGKIHPMQYEGFSYLGVGILFLSLIVFIYLIYKAFESRLWLKAKMSQWSYLYIVCLLMTFFALTNKITFCENILLEFPIPRFIEKLFYTFRATGRFVWPLYYFIIIISFLVVTKIKVKEFYKIIFLLVIVMVQVYDISTVITEKRSLPDGAYKTPLLNDEWVKLIENFDNVIVYPPFNYNYSKLYKNDYQDLCYLALKAKRPISNAYVARANGKKSEIFKQELAQNLMKGSLGNKTLYITTLNHIEDFSSLIKNNTANLYTLNGFYFVYSKEVKISKTTQKSDFKLDTIIKHYKNQKSATFSSVNFELLDKDEVSGYFDTFEFKENVLQVRGWAYLKNTSNNKGDSIYIALSSKSKNFIIPMKVDKRPDITAVYEKEFLDDAGFDSPIDTSILEKDNYQIGIIIKNKKGNYHYKKTDKTITVK